MRKVKLRFSVRTLLVATAALAVTIAFVANHLRVVLGAAIALLWLFEFAGGEIIDFLKAWPELKKPQLADSRRTGDVNADKALP